MSERRPQTMLGDLFKTITDSGRSIIDLAWARGEAQTAEGLGRLCQQLIRGAGEASNIALAGEVLDGYRGLDQAGKIAFFEALVEGFGPPRDALLEAARRFVDDPSPAHERRLSGAAEPLRRELIRRLNLSPGATHKLVELRADLLGLLRDRPDLAPLDNDLSHLLASWFNRGFLELRRIDWQTSAAVLEKVIAYEAVHTINDWDDLRARIAPPDRRLYGFFHPRLKDEPLIFVEVALVREMTADIGSILTLDRDAIDPNEARAAIFYSISNCQRGLRGISFGNFLIKQVVEELQHELLGLRTFATLSPVPAFASWIERLRHEQPTVLAPAAAAKLAILDEPEWHADAARCADLEKTVMPLAAHYFLNAKTSADRPIDPVARFHLGNGARLERLNWLADLSEAGVRQSYTLMVNYLYKLDEIERNHEAFVNEGVIATSRAIQRAARNAPLGTPVQAPA